MAPLIYSFVARGTAVLTDYTSYTGNIGAVAAGYLEKAPPGNSRFTFTCDEHTFNYLVEGGFSERGRRGGDRDVGGGPCLTP